MPGCGKTTIGMKLANNLNKKFIDTDELVEISSGKKISDLFLLGEDYFRDIESKVVKN